MSLGIDTSVDTAITSSPGGGSCLVHAIAETTGNTPSATISVFKGSLMGEISNEPSAVNAGVRHHDPPSRHRADRSRRPGSIGRFEEEISSYSSATHDEHGARDPCPGRGPTMRHVFKGDFDGSRLTILNDDLALV